MMYSDDVFAKKVNKKIRERTKENMEKYNMVLSDAFEEAIRTYAKKGTELWKAWYYSDLRKYIPCVYNKEYLDFEKYPLKYANK